MPKEISIIKKKVQSKLYEVVDQIALSDMSTVTT